MHLSYEDEILHWKPPPYFYTSIYKVNGFQDREKKTSLFQIRAQSENMMCFGAIYINIKQSLLNHFQTYVIFHIWYISRCPLHGAYKETHDFLAYMHERESVMHGFKARKLIGVTRGYIQAI